MNLNVQAMGPSYLVGLVGDGVTPSLTPPMHELEGARHGMRYVYRPIELSLDDGADALRRVLWAAERMNFNGLNITHPFKQRVIPLLDEVSADAVRVGAVNTVVIDNGRLIGHNTDASGFSWAYEKYLADAARGRVVLVGAGGAGSALATALASMTTTRELTIVDADVPRAVRLASALAQWADASVQAARPSDLEGLFATADGVINATPFGMKTHPGAAFDLGLLRSHLWVADIVYRPTVTVLLAEAARRGLRTMSGLGMAMAQAADAFEVFTGEHADRTSMLADLSGLVAQEAAAAASTANLSVDRQR